MQEQVITPLNRELPTKVVTAFLCRGERVLLLKRSSKVGTYRGSWAAVSGYLEIADPLEQALTEIREEVGLQADQLTLAARGPTLEVYDSVLNKLWIVHPFRFEVDSSQEIRLDWEHVDMRWVHPDEMEHLRAVPGLVRAWRLVSPPLL